MTQEEKYEFIKKEINNEINRLEQLESERLSCEDYAGALCCKSERQACLKIWNIVCIAEDFNDNQ